MPRQKFHTYLFLLFFHLQTSHHSLRYFLIALAFQIIPCSITYKTVLPFQNQSLSILESHNLLSPKLPKLKYRSLNWNTLYFHPFPAKAALLQTPNLLYFYNIHYQYRHMDLNSLMSLYHKTSPLIQSFHQLLRHRIFEVLVVLYVIFEIPKQLLWQ